MTVGERIKVLRKELGLNQSQFAEKIGLKQAAIGLYENNQRGVADHIRLLICEKYNVNEEWLRTGKGAIFTKMDSTIIAQLSKEYGLDSFEKALISGFLKLTPEQRSILKEQVKSMLREVISSDEAEEFLSTHSLKLKQKNTDQEQATAYLTLLESLEKSEREKWEREADEIAAMARAQFLQEKKRESQASSAQKLETG